MSWPLPCLSMGPRSFVCLTRLKIRPHRAMRGPRRPAREEPHPDAARTADGRSGRARIPGHSRRRPRRGVGRGFGAFASPPRNRQGPAPEPRGSAIRRPRAQAVGGPMNLNRRRAVPLWLLGLFTFSGPVGMHIFVPALPAAAKDLHATPAALELTISLYILGLAVGQLVYGPASDRFGRRPTLLVGLSIFTIASVAGLFAPDTHTLDHRALFPGCRRVFGAGARPRHHPRHVAGARGRAALGAHEFACDRRPRGRSADRRRAQQPLGVANDTHGAERPRRRQFRPGVAHSAGDPSGGALSSAPRAMPATISACCARDSFWATPSAAVARRPRFTRSSPARRLFLSIGCTRRARASASILRCWCPGSGSAAFSQAS